MADDGDSAYNNLSDDLLNLISQKIKTCPLDILRFRLVCRSWAKAASTPSTPTILSLSLPCCLDSPSSYDCHSLTLVASTVFLLQPPAAADDKLQKPWLVRVEERKPGKLNIQYPLSRSGISSAKLLINDFPKNWSSRAKTLHNAVNFISAHTRSKYFNGVLLSDFDKTLTCVGYSNTLRTISVLNLKSANQRGWQKIGYNIVFDDVVNYQGQVYAVDRLGQLFLVTKLINDGSRMMITTKISDGISCCESEETKIRKRLVVSTCQALYLVIRVGLRFRVYELMLNEKQWVEVSSVGDDVLFICSDYSFSVSATDLPGWGGNCIVLHAHSFPKFYCYNIWNDIEPALSSIFKDSEEELQIGIYHLASDQIIRHVSSFPGYCDMLWPPPSWINLSS